MPVFVSQPFLPGGERVNPNEGARLAGGPSASQVQTSIVPENHSVMVAGSCRELSEKSFVLSLIWEL